MLVFTLYYVPFVGLALLFYYLSSFQFRPYVLLVFSLLFISAISLKIALFSFLFTIVNFFFGLALARYRSKPRIKINLFWTFILLDIGVLSFFKYISPLLSGWDSFLKVMSWNTQAPYIQILIPLGISYYTFQALGYLIRISRGSEQPQTDFGVFSIYLLFFPKFLAGPVERSNHFFPQWGKPRKFSGEDLSEGTRIFIWGLFKKIVIANNLYPVIRSVYGNIHQFTGTALLTTFLIQAVYMYCDFSGYTDMALGTARLFGIDIIDNFKRPFLAKNVSDYWRRWHISLSSWCNDFIYNPFIVKYRQFGNTTVVVGIFLTFFVMGIWHGANWTYVTLGLLQAVAIVYEFHSKKYRLKAAAKFSKPIANTVSRILVYLFACLSMNFFYAKNIGDSWYFITHMCSDINFHSAGWAFIQEKGAFFSALFFFVALFILEIFMEKGKNLLATFLKQPSWVKWGTYGIGVLLIYAYRSEIGTFYYMRF